MWDEMRICEGWVNIYRGNFWRMDATVIKFGSKNVVIVTFVEPKWVLYKLWSFDENKLWKNDWICWCVFKCAGPYN